MKKPAFSLFFIIFLVLPLLYACGTGTSDSNAGPSQQLNTGDSPSSNTNIKTSEVTLAWEEPTTNIDGTPLTDLEGYRVYFGPGSGNYRYKNDVGTATTCTIGGLTPGYWCFVVTAYDTAGNESDYSNEVCVEIN